MCRDPGNDYLISLALDAKVDFLVTGDRDLLALPDEMVEFRICSPAEFVRIIESG